MAEHNYKMRPSLRHYRALVLISKSKHCACGSVNPKDWKEGGHTSYCPIHIAKVALKKRRIVGVQLKLDFKDK